MLHAIGFHIFSYGTITKQRIDETGDETSRFLSEEKISQY
jgi:hypothetical protein